MIKLKISRTTPQAVPVTRLSSHNSRKYGALLRSFNNSCHVRVRSHLNQVTITGMFGPQNRVNDVDRYRISVCGGICRVQPHANRQTVAGYNRYHDLAPDDAESDGTLLLLLESPHKDEYRSGDPGHPIAPAQGQAGTRIHSYLECILNATHNAHVKQRISNNCRVIIANPVPFQTSLWIIHRRSFRCCGSLRNAIWKTLWDVPAIRQDFCNRLQCFRPDVVLNCCTFELQKQLTPFLRQCGLEQRTYLGHHPSVWNCSVRLRS